MTEQLEDPIDPVGDPITDDRPLGDSSTTLKVKHLEFIQATISRMANNGFLLKGWTLTVGAAFFGFAVRELSWPIAAVGLLPILTFWALDAYFLRLERLFRRLYNAVVDDDPSVKRFSMDFRPFAGPTLRFRDAAAALPLLCFYGSLTVVALVVVVLTALHRG